MKLSANFSLEEFLVSQVAERNGIDMTPSPEVIENLQHLVDSVLQPLRDDAGQPVIITSGYRPHVLNEIIGGSKTSAHRFGRAADIKVVGETPFDTVQRIVRLDLEVDQVIHEFGRWVHVAVADLPRHQVLTAVREQGRTRYVEGLHELDALRSA